MAVETRPLRETDDRSAFHSGDPDLDRFFARYAGQNQFRHHVGTTYVAVEASRIIGYATVAAGHVEAETLTAALHRKLPRYPLPVLRLARLAVDAAARGRGVGSVLLRHVLVVALRMSEDLGCVGVVVDAKPTALGFDARLGFSALETASGRMESRPEPTPMFLPLELVAAALTPPPRSGA
jgi:GNAT superfamily N-acetyltransferase